MILQTKWSLKPLVCLLLLLCISAVTRSRKCAHSATQWGPLHRQKQTCIENLHTFVAMRHGLRNKTPIAHDDDDDVDDDCNRNSNVEFSIVIVTVNTVVIIMIILIPMFDVRCFHDHDHHEKARFQCQFRMQIHLGQS